MANAIIHYFQHNSGQYWQYVGQHLGLSALTLIIALVIALPLGSSNRKVAGFCTAFAQVLRIIPSLALLFY